MYHLTVPFKLSDSEFHELQTFLNKVIHITDNSTIFFDEATLHQLYSKPFWTTIVNFVNGYGMTEFQPSIFYYRSDPALIYNKKHIDGNTNVLFPMRFNILIKGRPGLTKWWDIDSKSDKIETTNKISNFYNEKVFNWSTFELKKEFNNLPADYESELLYEIQKYSSFLRTDLLHQNYRKPEWEDRMIFSLQSKQSWDTLNIL
jgi:hypothetical protein